MVAGDVISNGGQVMKYMYISTEIKRKFEIWCELQSERVNCQDCWKRNSGHSFQWTNYFWFTHKEGITLGAGEEIDEVAGEANGMGV